MRVINEVFEVLDRRAVGGEGSRRSARRAVSIPECELAPGAGNFALFAGPDRRLFKLTERERELVFSLGLAAQIVENLSQLDPR